MALLEKDKLEKIPPKRCNSQIKIARATYFSEQYGNKRYFQLGTFGASGNSENQTIRFDKETAIHLIQIFVEEFELQVDSIKFK